MSLQGKNSLPIWGWEGEGWERKYYSFDIFFFLSCAKIIMQVLISIISNLLISIEESNL